MPFPPPQLFQMPFAMNTPNSLRRSLLALFLCAATAFAAEPAKPAEARTYNWWKDQPAARQRVLTCPTNEFEKASDDYVAIFFNTNYPLNQRYQRVTDVEWPVLAHPMDVREALAKLKAESDRPDMQLTYYRTLLGWMANRYGARNRWRWDCDDVGADPLDESCSREARLALIEKALADPLVKDKASLLASKADLLTELFRFDEARSVLASLTASTNEAERADAYVWLATLCERRAGRFYTPAWRPYQQEALANYLLALNCTKGPRSTGNWGYRQKAVDCAIGLEEWSAAEKFLDAIMKSELHFRRPATNNFTAARMARIAWGRKDYAKVVEAFNLLNDKPAKEDYSVADQRHHAQALQLLGRYDEELVLLEKLSKTSNRRWRDYFAFCHDRLKKRLGK